MAQKSSNHSWGLKAGVNLADQIQPNGGGISDFKSSFGFYIGASVYLPVSTRFGISGEFQLSKISSALELNTSTIFSSDFDPVITSIKQESDYHQTVLQLPLLLQINLIDFISFQAGPQLSYIVRSKFEGFENEESIRISGEDTLGVDLATGFKIKLVQHLYLDGRYYFGLTKRNELKPSVFQMGFSYEL